MPTAFRKLWTRWAVDPWRLRRRAGAFPAFLAADAAVRECSLTALARLQRNFV
jgi:hypothetical protein